MVFAHSVCVSVSTACCVENIGKEGPVTAAVVPPYLRELYPKAPSGCLKLRLALSPEYSFLCPCVPMTKFNFEVGHSKRFTVAQ